METENMVSDFVYLLWFKSYNATTSKIAHPDVYFQLWSRMMKSNQEIFHGNFLYGSCSIFLITILLSPNLSFLNSILI